jgi:hypothetical protein
MLYRKNRNFTTQRTKNTELTVKGPRRYKVIIRVVFFEAQTLLFGNFAVPSHLSKIIEEFGFTSLNISPAFVSVECITIALAWKVSRGFVPIFSWTTTPASGALLTLRPHPCDPRSATHESVRAPELSSTNSAGAMNWYRGIRRRSRSIGWSSY